MVTVPGVPNVCLVTFCSFITLANGERQVFPAHTNSILLARRLFTDTPETAICLLAPLLLS